MTFAQIKQQILGKITQYPTASTANLPLTINNVYRYLCSIKRWSFLEASALFNTSAYVEVGNGDRVYGMPDDFKDIISVRYGAAWLEPLGVTDYDYFVSAQTTVGTPTHYVIYGLSANNQQELYLYPPASSHKTTTLKYWRRITDLSADADEPWLDEDYHNLIVLGVIADSFPYGDLRAAVQKEYKDAIAFMLAGMPVSKPKPSVVRLYRRYREVR